MDKFELGTFIVEREPQYPYFWLVKDNGIVIDRDRYSNDIRERFELGVYSHKANNKQSVTQG